MADMILEVPGQVQRSPEPQPAPAPKKPAKAGAESPYERGEDGWIRMSYAEAENYLARHGKLPEDAKAVLTERGRFLNAAKYDGKP